MAATSLLALIDDIAAVLDDIALMTKVAAKKTGGVLGDDLALNAGQIAGVRADRELPVVWAVAKGSAKNKLVLVPAALALSAFLPWAVLPLLMLGGAYLCYEGFEKIFHKLLHGKEEPAAQAERVKSMLDPGLDLVRLEAQKIKGAIRTDLILSAEIVVIALGTVRESGWAVQIGVVSGIAALMTVGVYGLVALIVKIDDAGLYLQQKAAAGAWGRITGRAGAGLVKAAPTLMKLLSAAGTIAMFMVGGGILVHGIPGIAPAVEGLAAAAGRWPGGAKTLEPLVSILANAALGAAAGAFLYAAVSLASAALKRFRPPKTHTGG
jgi:hypothetical protein